MAALDVQKKVYPGKRSFYPSISVRSNVTAFFCENLAKAEYALCDCN